MNYKMRLNFLLLFCIAAIISCTSETSETPKDLSKKSLIPLPVSTTVSDGTFELTDETAIYVQGENNELSKIGQFLADILNPSTGFGIKVISTNQIPGSGNIYLAIGEGDGELGEEGYELTVTADLVKITANEPGGLFRGVQTLRQLLPDEIEWKTVQQGSWEIPAVTIRDFPGYAYRGSMLDVSRHFFGVDDVKRYIDLIAAYKMNVLHLHLSDDQGWRIEIKSWPNLTTHGGSTQVGGGEGGFYTQEQYREIVQYASDRYITIIPEIDMPGHTNAALASYPELNCDGKSPELYTGIEVGFSTLCTDKEITYQFIDDVIRELAAMTPGPYIHIGGDESHVTALEDYIPFIERVQDIVQKHGKQVIGWDEIAHSKLLPNATVQYWAEAENASKGVEKGAKVVISPATRCYLDMQYDADTPLGLHWAAYIEVDDAYNWDPADLVPGISKENILGIEAPLWTETITKMDEIEYMVFPRLPGIAEVGWSLSSSRNWDEYRIRLGNQGDRFEAMGIKFYRSDLVVWAGFEN